MKVAVLIARLVMGAALTVFGLNGFLDFMPKPEPTVEGAVFLEALADTGYMLPLVSGVQLASGVFLLTGAFVPLGLVLFAPILVNAVAFHIYVDEPASGALAYVLVALELFLAWIYSPAFKGLFAFRAWTRVDD